MFKHLIYLNLSVVIRCIYASNTKIKREKNKNITINIKKIMKKIEKKLKHERDKKNKQTKNGEKITKL